MKKELDVKGDSASDNIVEKLESSLLFKADNHNSDQYKFEELKVNGDSVPHNIVEKLESRSTGVQNLGKWNDQSECRTADGLQEIKDEVRSKKRKLNTTDVAPIDIVVPDVTTVKVCLKNNDDRLVISVLERRGR
ncbi:hypothetical protein Q3G72_022856 [Acer saccharum]|nr:hypothetical protein Q3G72_022856 [Acer saccharum]